MIIPYGIFIPRYCFSKNYLYANLYAKIDVFLVLCANLCAIIGIFNLR